MKPSTKKLFVLLVVLTAGSVAGYKLMFSKLATHHERSPTPAPSAPEVHGKADYSPVSIARDQCRKLTNALRDFHSKRGHRPLPEGSSTDEKTVFPIDQAMLDALNGKDSAGVNYLKAAGFTAPVPVGRFYAAFDFNGDGSIPDPSATDNMVSQDILVWSNGEDGHPETWDDNAFAWLKP